MPVAKVNLPGERSIRIATGLILFAYAACHFLSHATGVFLLDNMEALGRGIVLAPWRTPLGRSALIAALFTHGFLGLYALYRRRHLRMPALEAWQLGLGLLIPLLMIPHISNVRLGYSLYGFDDSYYRIVYSYWLTQPLIGLPRQFFLLLTVWIHGSIGIHMWLRFRPWYRHWSLALLGAAVLIPILAVIGINNAGWDAFLRARLEPGFAALHGPPPSGTAAASHADHLARLWEWLQVAYVALVAIVFLARYVRNWHERRTRGIVVAYSNGPKVTMPRGFSILEASRWIGLPHASVCGARGRCSTCRVRVLKGLDRLPSPSARERATLERVRAPPGVRLACQVRPISDVTVVRLVPAGKFDRGLGVDLRGSRELMVTALCVDLRDATRLAAGRLPFDPIFIVDRYIQAVTAAIQACGGYVTSIAGDGVMAVFGLKTDPARAARDAIAAAAGVWSAIDFVSCDLADELGSALRFGAGIHSGLSVIGTIGPPGQNSIQFLGDTGNVTARLEALTKELGCIVIISAATVALADPPAPAWRQAEVSIRGREAEPLSVFLIESREELAPERSGAESA
ncbi:MAG: adenylate/guanylate cyclase domain-containing protein [Methylobacteriaceae bacterium]|nr:adenylate/guanylate cyclase domain-containing protein [Methylobacteriaceae bacterium]